MKRLLVMSVLTACHATHAAAPAPAPRAMAVEARVEAALARWSASLQEDEKPGAEPATDQAGQLAIVYGGAKLAASHVDGGAEAVERTATGIVIMTILQILWPEHLGEPFQTWNAVVPAGSLGPALVATGLATPSGDTAHVYVPVSWQATFGRVAEARRAHERTLRERRAWTCRLAAIEGRIDPSEPILQRGAAISTTVAGWLREVEGIHLVRARCASGAALFAITARGDGDDQVLLAKLL